MSCLFLNLWNQLLLHLNEDAFAAPYISLTLDFIFWQNQSFDTLAPFSLLLWKADKTAFTASGYNSLRFTVDVICLLCRAAVKLPSPFFALFTFGSFIIFERSLFHLITKVLLEMPFMAATFPHLFFTPASASLSRSPNVFQFEIEGIRFSLNTSLQISLLVFSNINSYLRFRSFPECSFF